MCQQNDYSKAEEYYNLSENCFKDINEINNIAHAYLGKGIVNDRLDNFEEAFDYFNKALNIASDSFLIGSISYQKGISFFYLEENDSALIYFKKCLNYPDHNEKSSYKYVSLAHLYFEMEQYDSASLYINTALNYPSNFYNKRDAYAISVNIAAALNDTFNMQYYMKLYQQYVDSIILFESQPTLKILEEVHSTNIKAVKAGRYNCIFMIATIILLVVVSVLYYFYRKQFRLK